MKPPQDDLENRLPVWDALQMLFMDTDIEGMLEENSPRWIDAK